MAEQIIRVSQIGYLPEAKKFAIIMTGDSGRWEYTRYDFSDLKEEGWHQLKIGEAVSDSFLIENCLQSEIISYEVARLMQSATSNSVMRAIPTEYREYMRASLLKQMLLTQI